MRRFSIGLVLLGLSLAGCAAFGPHYATVPSQSVTDFEIGLAGGGTRYCPAGPEVQLRAGVRTADGTARVTWAYGHGGIADDRESMLDFASFDWRASAGTITTDGLYQPADVLASLDRPVTIDATVKGRPDLHRQLTLTPSYGCLDIVERNGEAGAAGATGSFGSNGTDASSGSGGDGSDGGSGGAGSDGARGPSVTVALAYVDGAAGRHVIARIDGAGTSQYAVIDPGGPPLSVTARGGAGGAGGSGGRGGSGGHGAPSTDTSPAGSDGSNGRDGSDGVGGNGGPGGRVRVVYDRAHPELASMITVDTHGGDPGFGAPSGARGLDGPPPAFTPGDPSVLFFSELARGIPVEK